MTVENYEATNSIDARNIPGLPLFVLIHLMQSIEVLQVINS